MLGLFITLYHQSQPLDFSAVFCAGGHNIDAGRVNAAMAKNVCQLRYILFDTVEGAGKQLTQVVGKYFAGIDPGILAQLFHLRPYTASI